MKITDLFLSLLVEKNLCDVQLAAYRLSMVYHTLVWTNLGTNENSLCENCPKLISKKLLCEACADERKRPGIGWVHSRTNRLRWTGKRCCWCQTIWDIVAFCLKTSRRFVFTRRYTAVWELCRFWASSIK